MRLVRGRMPSPAMVIALIALFSSLGGVSYGLATGVINGREVKNRSLTGKDLRKNSVGGTVVKESDLGVVPSAALATQAGVASQAGGLTHFATVNSEGGLINGRGVLSAFKTSENGDYQVVFDKLVTNCAYSGTIVSATAVNGAQRGQIGLGLAAADNRALHVQTTNAEGGPAQRPFHVLVAC